jgi:N-methylhydantoinase B/oxoprolinase/acetone carboxylase alpha subunit
MMCTRRTAELERLLTDGAYPVRNVVQNVNDLKAQILEAMDCAILSGHRRVRPFGLKGGSPGELGLNVVRRRDGTCEQQPGCCQVRLEAGDAIMLRTPTCGGYGDIDELSGSS